MALKPTRWLALLLHLLLLRPFLHLVFGLNARGRLDVLPAKNGLLSTSSAICRMMCANILARLSGAGSSPYSLSASVASRARSRQTVSSVACSSSRTRSTAARISDPKS